METSSHLSQNSRSRASAPLSGKAYRAKHYGNANEGGRQEAGQGQEGAVRTRRRTTPPPGRRETTTVLGENCHDTLLRASVVERKSVSTARCLCQRVDLDVEVMGRIVRFRSGGYQVQRGREALLQARCMSRHSQMKAFFKLFFVLVSTLGGNK